MNRRATAAATSSAATMEIQIPSIPQISGKISTAAAWNTRVRRKEMRAEIRPLFSAVKKPEPNMAKPAKRKEKEKILKA